MFLSTARRYSEKYNSYLITKRMYPNTECIIEKSARKGDLSMLVWLKNNKVKLNKKALYIAAGNGHLDIVKVLYTDEHYNVVKEWARLNGQKNVLNWLKQ